jgi:hypothetical protein
VPEARGSAGPGKDGTGGVAGRFRRERDRAGLVESGKRGIGCHRWNVVIDMRDAVADQDVRPHSHRRLSDWVLITFHFACDEGNLEVAEQLIAILEHMLRRAPPEGHSERRLNSRPLIAAHERLWGLRRTEARHD